MFFVSGLYFLVRSRYIADLLHEQVFFPWKGSLLWKFGFSFGRADNVFDSGADIARQNLDANTLAKDEFLFSVFGSVVNLCRRVGW